MSAFGAAVSQAVSSGTPRCTGPDAQVLFDGGPFVLGLANCSEHWPEREADGECPGLGMRLAPFLLDRCEVSNEAFAQFVAATGHVTVAERLGDSLVFAGLLAPSVYDSLRRAVAEAPWWLAVPGAHWRRPEGPTSSLDCSGAPDAGLYARLARWAHPVVHVAWDDAAAFCAWRGARLPSEAELEFALRAHAPARVFPWGDAPTDTHGKQRANVWQGPFPAANSMEDGHFGTAPVGSFATLHDGSGDALLYDLLGNVWEWATAARGAGVVLRGGSFLCHPAHCYRFRSTARSPTPRDTTASNAGFRCAAPAPAAP